MTKKEYEIDDSKTYYWTEIHSNAHAPILREMIEPQGIEYPLACRLEGESNKGRNAVDPKQRMVKFDLSYCIHKVDGLLKRLTPDQKERFLKAYLTSVNPSIESVQQEKEESAGGSN